MSNVWTAILGAAGLGAVLYTTISVNDRQCLSSERVAVTRGNTSIACAELGIDTPQCPTHVLTGNDALRNGNGGWHGC